jgi:hypothetical protein
MGVTILSNDAMPMLKILGSTVTLAGLGRAGIHKGEIPHKCSLCPVSMINTSVRYL